MAELAAPLLQKRPGYRIDSIDLLRGLVMIIMALDHTRDFFHTSAWTQDPLDLATTTPLLYFTRWITHLCAPLFVFLAGTGAYFQSLKKSKKELSGFLITRGLWLLFVEIVIINFAFTFDVHYCISMIILGLVVWLPFTAILLIGSIIVFGHNTLDIYEKTLKAQPDWWYSILHMPGFYKLWDGHNLLILYPFLSWSGLMMLGYCFGRLFLNYEGSQRKKMLLWLGMGILVFFIALRLTNRAGADIYYGDAQLWSEQGNLFYTFLSFMNLRKYPPSLLYMCATIGIGMIILAVAGKAKNRLSKFIIVYGRVPFFYYVLHFFLIHLLSSIAYLLRGHSFAEGTKPTGGLLPQFAAQNEGYSLAIVYAIWIFVVVSLYPLCKWFSDYKQRHRDKKWLSYL
jgi:uncharacterized membrane protein